jgi:hypothetical protein
MLKLKLPYFWPVVFFGGPAEYSLLAVRHPVKPGHKNAAVDKQGFCIEGVGIFMSRIRARLTAPGVIFCKLLPNEI